MKKILAFFLSGMMLFLMVGCKRGKEDISTEESDKLNDVSEPDTSSEQDSSSDEFSSSDTPSAVSVQSASNAASSKNASSAASSKDVPYAQITPVNIWSQSRFSDENVINGSAVTTAMKQLVIGNKNAPGYSVAISVNGKLAYRDFQGNQVFNYPDYEKAYAQDTVLEVASVTKGVFAALVFKCVEDGLVKLDDPVKKYSSDMYYNDVTIYHLLTHSGGYDDAALAKKVSWNGTRESLPAYIKAVYQFNERAFSPGSESRYYVGYVLLMDIIEKVTGKTIEDYAQEVLFKPLNMTSTHCDNLLIDKSKYICKNDYNISQNKDNLFLGNANTPCYGNAGLFTSVDDMYNFTLMLYNKGTFEGRQVMKAETVTQMVTRCEESRLERSPAFFMNLNPGGGPFSRYSSKTTVGHPGSSGTLFFVDYEKNITGVFLSNNGVNLTGSRLGQTMDIVYKNLK